jgi:hypothetical protein
MRTREQFTTDKRSIPAFVAADFKKQGMNLALAMVRNPETQPADLRAVIDHYRDLWRRRHGADLKLVRR